jgi:hypothetical protein
MAAGLLFLGFTPFVLKILLLSGQPRKPYGSQSGYDDEDDPFRAAIIQVKWQKVVR